MDKNSEIVTLIVIRLFLIAPERAKSAEDTVDPWRFSDRDIEAQKRWVLEKYDLFKNRNLPNVLAQTYKDFDYLVLVNKKFSHYSLIRDDIEKNSHLYNLKYVSIPWGDGLPEQRKANPFLAGMQDFIKDYVTVNYPNCKWLITKRIDNDDLICKDFMESVHKHFNKTERFITFNNGYTYRLQRPGLFYKHSDFNNAHHSYCEPFSSNIKTVYHKMHNKLRMLPGRDDKLLAVGQFDPWEKGYWMDGAGFDSNIKKNPRVSKRWRQRVNEDDLRDITENFIINF